MLRASGTCSICDRTRSDLDVDTLMCSECAQNPAEARRRRAREMLRCWFFWRPLALLIWFALAFGLVELMHWIDRFRH